MKKQKQNVWVKNLVRLVLIFVLGTAICLSFLLLAFKSEKFFDALFGKEVIAQGIIFLIFEWILGVFVGAYLVLPLLVDKNNENRKLRERNTYLVKELGKWHKKYVSSSPSTRIFSEIDKISEVGKPSSDTVEEVVNDADTEFKTLQEMIQESK